MNLLGYFKLIVKFKHYNNTILIHSRTINSDVHKFSEVTVMTDNVNNDRSWLAYVWHYFLKEHSTFFGNMLILHLRSAWK